MGNANAHDRVLRSLAFALIEKPVAGAELEHEERVKVLVAGRSGVRTAKLADGEKTASRRGEMNFDACGRVPDALSV
jgi:hypothetical protein